MVQVGDTIDGYRIEAVIGRGGMGTVYRGVDTGLDKEVALKVIAPHLAEDPTFLARFRSEARALGRLDAPGIVRVLALRESDRATFIAMEYVDGPPLRELLRKEGALPWPDAVSILRQILAAVGHAHASGVLHRDLKPSNILLTTDGHVKITDFGLAKIRTSDTDLTATHETAGTVAYMSPEQIEGLKNVDERSDLFSVGLIAYEMLAGQLPFSRSGSYYAIQRAIVQEPFAPPSEHVGDLPRRIDRVIGTLLKKDAEQRYQDAESALEALEPLDAPSRVPAPALRDRAGTPDLDSETSTWTWVGIGAVLLLVAAGVVYAVASLLDVSATTSAPDPTADTTAVLRIETTPSADVVVNGDTVGRAPIASVNVPAGSVHVAASRPDYAPAETTLSASGRQQIRLSLDPVADPETASPPLLRASTGQIRVRSTPSGADVVVDGEVAGTTPMTLTGLPEGDQPIVLRKEGYRSAVARISVEAGERSQVDTRLEARPAIVRLQFMPFATIRINGAVVAPRRVEAFVDSLQPGSHRIEATYRSARWVRTFSLEPGEEVSRTIDFTKTVQVSIVAQTPDGTALPNAEILVDGESAGYAPQKVDLRVGRHNIRVKKSGYVDAVRTVDVDTEAAGRLVFVLSPSSAARNSRSSASGDGI